MTSRHFKESGDVLEGETCEIRLQEIDKRPNKIWKLAKYEENTLWECSQLGVKAPKSIFDTLLWFFTLHFRSRGRQKHLSTNIEEFSFSKEDN